jgi:hypothetical protein
MRKTTAKVTTGKAIRQGALWIDPMCYPLFAKR